MSSDPARRAVWAQAVVRVAIVVGVPSWGAIDAPVARACSCGDGPFRIADAVADLRAQGETPVAFIGSVLGAEQVEDRGDFFRYRVKVLVAWAGVEPAQIVEVGEFGPDNSCGRWDPRPRGGQMLVFSHFQPRHDPPRPLDGAVFLSPCGGATEEMLTEYFGRPRRIPLIADTVTGGCAHCHVRPVTTHDRRGGSRFGGTACTVAALALGVFRRRARRTHRATV